MPNHPKKLDCSLCRNVLLLAFVLTRLGRGNMAEIVTESEEDGGTAQTGCVQSTHLSVPAGGGCACRVKVQ